MPPEPKHDQQKHEPPPRNQRQSKAVDESSKDSFPASDAPGTHLPDEPPSNADAKWEAAKKLHRERNSH
jgi:hypothetical protein